MNKLPNEFYRFRGWPPTGLNRTKDLLEKAAFYCAGPRDFDDIHDCQLGAFRTGSKGDLDRWLANDMAGIPELMRKYQLSSITDIRAVDEMDPKEVTTLRKCNSKHERRHKRILCFSSAWDNELMWTFYSDHHRGLCLCFDTRDKFFRDAQPVQYSNSLTALQCRRDGETSFDISLSRKSTAWRFQSEWRIVLDGDQPKHVTFPKLSLKSIILGYRFPDAQFTELEQCVRRGGYSLDIVRVERLYQSYKLAVRPICRIDSNYISSD